MPRLSNQQRSGAVGMLRANATVAHVANHFEVYRVYINKLRHRLQATGSVNDRPRSGRPRVTSYD